MITFSNIKWSRAGPNFLFTSNANNKKLCGGNRLKSLHDTMIDTLWSNQQLNNTKEEATFGSDSGIKPG